MNTLLLPWWRCCSLPWRYASLAPSSSPTPCRSNVCRRTSACPPSSAASSACTRDLYWPKRPVRTSWGKMWIVIAEIEIKSVTRLLRSVVRIVSFFTDPDPDRTFIRIRIQEGFSTRKIFKILNKTPHLPCKVPVPVCVYATDTMIESLFLVLE